MQLFQLVTNR